MRLRCQTCGAVLLKDETMCTMCGSIDVVAESDLKLIILHKDVEIYSKQIDVDFIDLFDLIIGIKANIDFSHLALGNMKIELKVFIEQNSIILKNNEDESLQIDIKKSNINSLLLNGEIPDSNKFLFTTNDNIIIGPIELKLEVI